MDYQEIITIEAGKRSGKPCIRGMRITVYDILEYLASGMTEAEILEDFSELTSDDIKGCIAFTEDNVHLRQCFLEQDWQKWDQEIEEDAEAGKLDFLIEEALEEKDKNQLRDI